MTFQQKADKANAMWGTFQTALDMEIREARDAKAQAQNRYDYSGLEDREKAYANLCAKSEILEKLVRQSIQSFR